MKKIEVDIPTYVVMAISTLYGWISFLAWVNGL